jgi:hypothetical protein
VTIERSCKCDRIYGFTRNSLISKLCTMYIQWYIHLLPPCSRATIYRRCLKFNYKYNMNVKTLKLYSKLCRNTVCFGLFGHPQVLKVIFNCNKICCTYYLHTSIRTKYLPSSTDLLYRKIYTIFNVTIRLRCIHSVCSLSESGDAVLRLQCLERTWTVSVQRSERTTSVLEVRPTVTKTWKSLAFRITHNLTLISHRH